MIVQYDNFGKIMGVITTNLPADVLQKVTGHNCLWVDIPVDMGMHCVKDGSLAEKEYQKTILTNGTIYNAPVEGAVLYVDDIEYKISDETIDLLFLHSGVYKLKITAPKYYDWLFEYTYAINT